MIRLSPFLSPVWLLIFLLLTNAQTMTIDKKAAVKIHHITKDFPVTDLANRQWVAANEVVVGTYWSGKAAPAGRRFAARMLWSGTALYVRFEARQTEPLIVSDRPSIAAKTLKLWDRDVCEIFIAPDKTERRKYFEFEVAPNGEWVDLAIDLTSGKRETDWEYRSGMEATASIGTDMITMAIRIEWKALGKTPRLGDVWLGNLLRCVGKDPTRGYLAWQPTFTKEPAFHVPEKFGEFKFVG
jgi:hypothetical protein